MVENENNCDIVNVEEEYVPPEAHYFTLKDFKFNNGYILEEAKVEYMTFGAPKYDENGKIVNAVVYFHGSGGDYSSISHKEEIIGPGLIFDTDKFFIISPTALGHPGSACPSSTGLMADFPEYDVFDMVNFLYRFIQEKFDLTKIKGLIGNSMGGFEVLAWASMYPDSVEFAIPMVSSHKLGGHNFALSYIMNTILESDPDYNGGFYETPISESLKRSMRLASHVMYTYGFSREYYRWGVTNEELAEGMEEFACENLEGDINDLVYSNNSFLDYDLTNQMKDITAKVLIIAINQDQYFPPNLDAIPLSKLIKNNKLLIYDSELGHLGSSDLYIIEKDIREFLKEFEE